MGGVGGASARRELGLQVVWDPFRGEDDPGILSKWTPRHIYRDPYGEKKRGDKVPARESITPGHIRVGESTYLSRPPSPLPWAWYTHLGWCG